MSLENLILLRCNNKLATVYDKNDKSKETCKREMLEKLPEVGVKVRGVKETSLEPVISKTDTELSNLVLCLSNNTIDDLTVRLNYIDNMVQIKLFFGMDLGISPSKRRYVYEEYDGTQGILLEDDWDNDGLIKNEYESDCENAWKRLPFSIQNSCRKENGSLELGRYGIQYVNYIEWHYNKFGDKEVKEWLDIVKEMIG